ncbi:MAG: terpene cyclase/mutase family protein [Polyangiales bacterium]
MRAESSPTSSAQTSPVHADAKATEDAAAGPSVIPAASPTRAALRVAIERAAEHLACRQAADGHWPGDYGGPLFLLPGLIFAHHITGAPLPPERAAAMRRYLASTQRPDGGFGLHVAGASTVFGTTLNYVAWRLLGLEPEDERAVAARTCLHALGGAAGIPTWGKCWLAQLGLYDWDGVMPLLPELWLQPRWAPTHPERFWCHTRQVFLPMSYLYGHRVVGPVTPTIEALRREIFCEDWAHIDWSQLRMQVAESDLYTPHSRVLKAVSRVLDRYAKTPLASLRRRALAEVTARIHHEDESTAYLTIGPVSKALHMVAVWHSDPAGPAFQRHLARVDDYLWEAPEGLKMQGYNGSQFWDTAFACLALLESGLPQEEGAFVPTLRQAHAFIDANQVTHNVPAHRRFGREVTVGAFPFSTAEQAWPVSDCTAEGLKAALKLAPLVHRPLAPGRLHAAVDRILAWQNPDGGWSEYERARAPRLVEHLNAAEVFGDIMRAYSYTECTSACIQGLVAYRARFSSRRRRAIDRAIVGGRRYLERAQRDDGSWYGGWGICFTYGTWFGVEGLLAAGCARHSPAIRRALAFLRLHQRADGSWAESYESCVQKRWVEASEAQPIQSAWALLALMAGASTAADTRAIAKGLHFLLRTQRSQGDWAQASLAGVFNRNCMIHYDNYGVVMPLWALARAFRRST